MSEKLLLSERKIKFYDRAVKMMFTQFSIIMIKSEFVKNYTG